MFPKQARILLVDDEQGVTNLLSITLEEDGYNCVTAATGEEALKKLSTDGIDVALLDLGLPGKSGMDVLKEITSNYPKTVVIILTGVRDTQTAVEAMKSGAVDYITKPFKFERVSNSIETALQKKSAGRKEPTPTRDITEAGNDDAGWTAHLDAIARGLELKLESITAEAWAKTIVERTVDAALALDIPEDQIKKWTVSRLKQDAVRTKVMNFLLKKLERNPINQIVLGMTDPYRYPPGHDSCLN